MRKLILDNLPKGYQEIMDFGMICYVVPFKHFPDTYNGHPLIYCALAAQKHYASLYCMTVYGKSRSEAALKAAFKKAGKKLDMGKCCIRFQTPGDLPLPVVQKLIAAMPLKKYIDFTIKTCGSRGGCDRAKTERRRS